MSRAKHADHRVACGLEREACGAENLSGDSCLDAEESKQEVLGADVIVVEITRLGHCVLQYLLGASRVWQVLAEVPRRRAGFHRVEHGSTQCRWINAKTRDDRHREIVSIADQSEELVLGAGVVVSEHGRLFTRERERLPYSFGEVVTVHYKSAQLLLICLQSAQINLHLRHSSRGDAQ
jgi:hypothetical protein